MPEDSRLQNVRTFLNTSMNKQAVGLQPGLGPMQGVDPRIQAQLDRQRAMIQTLLANAQPEERPGIIRRALPWILGLGGAGALGYGAYNMMGGREGLQEGLAPILNAINGGGEEPGGDPTGNTPGDEAGMEAPAGPPVTSPQSDVGGASDEIGGGASDPTLQEFVRQMTAEQLERGQRQEEALAEGGGDTVNVPGDDIREMIGPRGRAPNLDPEAAMIQNVLERAQTPAQAPAGRTLPSELRSSEMSNPLRSMLA